MDPDGMSREALIEELERLRAEVAHLRAQVASVRAEMKSWADMRWNQPGRESEWTTHMLLRLRRALARP